MTAQSFLAKFGIRSGILGSPSALAFAAPVANGILDADAATFAGRIGYYFDRTIGQERMGFVVMGTETVQFRQTVTNSLVPVSVPAATVAASSLIIPEGVAPAAPTDGMVWVTSLGMFVRAGGVTIGPFGGGGGLTGTLVSGRVPFADGTSSLTDNAKMVFSATTGFNVNMASSGANNLTLGTGAGDSMTTADSTVAIGKDALGTMTSGSGGTAVGFEAGLNHTSGGLAAFGYNAGRSAGGNVTAIGYGALDVSTGSANVAVGTNAGGTLTTGDNNVFLGSGSGFSITTGSRNIILGVLAGGSASTSNTFVAGSQWDTSFINQVFFGSGIEAPSPIGYTINGSGASGTDIAGAAMMLAGGKGTGTGVGGSLIFQTAKAGTTGATLNPLLTRLAVDQDGRIEWTGITTANAPAVSAASNGAIFFDSTLNKFRVSQNGAAYADLVGGGGGTIGGSIASGQVAVGSGVNTVAGSSNLTWTTTNGLSSNRVAAANNEMFGFGAGNTTLTGLSNTIVGNGAAPALTTGNQCVFVGRQAGLVATTAVDSTCVGHQAGGAMNANQVVYIGEQAGFNSSGAGNIGIGSNALFGAVGSTGTGNIGIGLGALQALSTDVQNVALGTQTLTVLAGATGRNVAIGYQAGMTQTSINNSILLGRSAGENDPTTGLTNVFIAGSTTSPINEVYFGKGHTNAGATAYAIRGTNGTGSNNAGGGLTLAGGNSTGTGNGGTIVFTTAPAGASGSTLNTSVTRLSIPADGRVEWTGITTASSPAVSAANNGAVFYDRTLQKFQASQNGAAYVDLIGAGTIGGSIASGQVAVGSGANTVAGSSNLTWTTANGLSSNRVAAVNNELFGLNAGNTTLTGTGNTILGASSGTGITSGINNVILGFSNVSALTSGNANIFIGSGITLSGNLSNFCIIGSTATNTWILGNADSSGTPLAVLLQPTNAAGTNIAGSNFTLLGGRSTGSGSGGDILLRTSKAAGSGSAANAVVTRLSVIQDGRIEWTGITTANAPAVSTAAAGAIFFDSTLSKFRVSQNGAAYVDLISTAPNVVNMWSSTSTATVANTTTETTVIGSGIGTVSIPANVAIVGTIIRIWWNASIKTTSTPSFEIKVKIGSSVFSTTGTIAMVDTSTLLVPIQGYIELTYRVIGAGGQLAAFSTAQVGNPTGTWTSKVQTDKQGSLTAVDTTIANNIDLTVQWGTASTNNSIAVEHTSVDIVRSTFTP
jgi:hypothetical protein